MRTKHDHFVEVKFLGLGNSDRSSDTSDLGTDNTVEYSLGDSSDSESTGHSDSSEDSDDDGERPVDPLTYVPAQPSSFGERGP